MKKRYQLTLTPAHVDEMHRHLAVLGLPKSALSAVVDDWLANFVPILSKMADKKRRGEQMTFDEIMGDLFVSIGAAMKP
jgi:uncharacterized membrane-anchored protein